MERTRSLLLASTTLPSTFLSSLFLPLSLPLLSNHIPLTWESFPRHLQSAPSSLHRTLPPPQSIPGHNNTRTMDHDDVNSSDIEYEPTANEFAGAGAQSVELMLERAVENRLESKKAAKQLQFVQNSKKTMYINYLWYVLCELC